MFSLIIFLDLILIFYIWVPNTTIKETMKFKQHFALDVWPKNNGFSLYKHFSFVVDNACSLHYVIVCGSTLFTYELSSIYEER